MPSGQPAGRRRYKRVDMKSTIVDKAVRAFLQSLRQRNASIHTIKAYRGDLGEFAAYAGSRGWKRIGSR